MSFTTIDLTDGGQIRIGEANEDGSFVRTEGDNPSITVKFNIFGADNASTAYTALINYLYTYFSDNYGGIANYDLPLDTVQINTTRSQYVYVGECVFQYKNSIDASSNSPADTSSNINSPSYSMPEVEDASFTFSTTGGTSHITHGIARLGSARYDGAAPIDYGVAVGPHDDGSIVGADIVTPTMNFDISVSLPRYWFSIGYRLAIAEATGCVNSLPWGGFAAGCCLFKGVDASATWMKWTSQNGRACREWYWRAVFHFEAASAETANIGGTVLYKRGFDYFSKVVANYPDQATGDTVSAVEQVDVIQLYPEFNFSLLNLNMPY
jgi:hypothetical protein